MNILDFIVAHWGTISVFLGGVIYALTHYQFAKSFATKKAIDIMFSVEANAEKLAVETGKSKFDFVVSKGYDMLPSYIRVVISKPLFAIIVQSLFDKALEFAKAHAVVTPIAPTVVPVIDPTVQV